MKSKKEIRNEILKTRRNLGEKEVFRHSAIICDAVRSTEKYRNAANLCLYMPINNEVDVTPLMKMAWQDGKHVWLPKVSGKKMEFYSYDEKTELVNGAFNIPEPDSNQMLVDGCSTLVVMPGAVFSENRDRIGYGGGYYDVFLQEHNKCDTIAVCYDFQIIQTLPAEKHDVKPQMIVSENRTITD